MEPFKKPFTVKDPLKPRKKDPVKNPFKEEPFRKPQTLITKPLNSETP